MGLISKTKTWADNEGVNYDDMNANFDTVYNVLNGNVDNENVKSSAGILESKLAFNTSSGHDHDGTNSKAIPKGLVFNIVGTLTTGTSLAPLLVSTGSLTISKAYLNVKTAPTGADLIIDIDKSTDNGQTWVSIWNTTQANRVKIVAGSFAGTQTSFDTTSLAEGNLLRVNVDQVGSSNPGADLTITLKA